MSELFYDYVMILNT